VAAPDRDPDTDAGAAEAAVDAIHAAALVVDSHLDTAMRYAEAGFDFMARNATGHVDYERLREGGLDAIVMAVYLGKPGDGGPADPVPEALRRIEWIHTLAEIHPDRLSLAVTAGEVSRAVAESRIALLIGIEGGHIIDNSLEVLRRFHGLGVRVLTLTHSFHHEWADSSGFAEALPPRHGGLTDFGRDVVRELNRLGMVADVSHASEATVRDVLEISTAPVAATHSACRALCDHPRNMSDELMTALAANGGVIQIPYFPGFLDPAFGPAARAVDARRKARGDAARARWDAGSGRLEEELRAIEEELPLPSAPLSSLLDHIDHAVRVAGPAHVGLGSDWDGIRCTVRGLEDCSGLPRVTRGLVERGHDSETIKGILGGNFLRVLAEAGEGAL
jgi:membrane dipeptidase